VPRSGSAVRVVRAYQVERLAQSRRSAVAVQQRVVDLGGGPHFARARRREKKPAAKVLCSRQVKKATTKI
jgi:hypothetical protein